MNPGPPPCEGGALPAELPAPIILTIKLLKLLFHEVLVSVRVNYALMTSLTGGGYSAMILPVFEYVL